MASFVGGQASIPATNGSGFLIGCGSTDWPATLPHGHVERLCPRGRGREWVLVFVLVLCKGFAMSRQSDGTTLSPRQMEIMNIIWARGKATVAEVWEEINRRHQMMFIISI